MKTLIGIFALLAVMALPAVANAPGGISGTILAPDGQSVANAPVAFFRLPLHNVDAAVATVNTDRNGFFTKVALQPGRYMVAVAVRGNLSACQVEDIYDDAMTRVKMTLQNTTACRGARLHSAMVNPAIGASFYLVH
jgi:hypothetical protein